MALPDSFAWGAATASYQIEGGYNEDGKGLSVWDMMCRWPGKVAEGMTGDIACDHYHRYKEDVRLMKEIGLQAYRMSISWPRVIPNGTGKINDAGLDFYDRLIDALCAHDIDPWVTLFHWDFPYELYCRGGWLNPDSSDWFADYTRVIAEKLSDRVSHWITLNEPQIFVKQGHQDGYHAPGLVLSEPDVLRVAHNALLAHGKAVQTLRSVSSQPACIGASPSCCPGVPATESDADIAAARYWLSSMREKDFYALTWFCDPMILGHYPEDGLKLFDGIMPSFPDSDMKTICQPLDFFGVNVYAGMRVCAQEDGSAAEAPIIDGTGETSMEWKVIPDALYWGPRFMYERYSLPVVITENGMANNDWLHLDGHVHDAPRIDFLQRYISAFLRAVDDGVPALGYFHWSAMDNFEWAFGYKRRFGLIYVDYPTQKRYLKDSALWYRDLIASHGESL